MGWLQEERETVLLFDYIKKIWIIYTNIPKHWRKFKKNGFTLISESFEKTTGLFFDAKFECPERLITFRNLNKINQKNEINEANEEVEEDEDILPDEGE